MFLFLSYILIFNLILWNFLHFLFGLHIVLVKLSTCTTERREHFCIKLLLLIALYSTYVCVCVSFLKIDFPFVVYLAY